MPRSAREGVPSPDEPVPAPAVDPAASVAHPGTSPVPDEPPDAGPAPGELAASWAERLALLTSPGAGPPRPPALATVAAVAVVVVVVAVGVVAWARPTPAPELSLPLAGAGPGAAGAAAPGAGPAPAPAPATTGTIAPAVVVVHAAGAVARPGVYRLAGGARVSDVLDAAGGPVPEAEVDRLNLAAQVSDGERVYVPRHGEDAPPPAGAGGAGGAAGSPPPVHLNTASVAELEALPGIGPAIAAAIVDERERRGGFATVDDLLDVRGIGEARLATLRDLVRV